MPTETPRVAPASLVRSHWLRSVLLTVAAFLFAACAPLQPSGEADTEAELKALELERLRALVEGDLQTADALHADDFELVTPTGDTFTKAGYLGGIEAGSLTYRDWTADVIEVRLYGDTALLRYRDLGFTALFNGSPAWAGRLVHTNLYEKRDGAWVIVWSHASGGAPVMSGQQ